MEAKEDFVDIGAKDLGAFLDAGATAVVTLEAGDTRLVAHRAVLSARSPVFAAKFHHGTSEAIGEQLTIPDVEGPVLRQLLAYLYTLQAPQLPGMATQLLAAADTYGLSVLKADCERQVAAQLSVQTAAATAILAVRHSCDSLTQAAIKCIKAHTHHVMATEGWADAVRTQPDLLVEVCQLLSQLPSAFRSPVSESSTMEAVEVVRETTGMDLGALLDAGEDAMVTLVAGDTCIVAHRAVLAARSPVFRHDTQEASSGQLTIPDMEGPVLRQMLSYLYTLEAPQLPSMAPQLLAAADMYGVSVLKAECEHQVKALLSVETAAATAVLAVRHSCDSLRNAAVALIKAHTHEVMATQGWAEAVYTQPKDVVEVSKLLSQPVTETSVPYLADSDTTTNIEPHIDINDAGSIPASTEPPLVAKPSRITAAASISYMGMLSAEEKGKSLIQAAEQGAVDDVKALLGAGADVGVRECRFMGSGWTALHCAANGGHEQAVSHLLAAGAEVDARDVVQRTPLHWAAVRGHAGVVRQLAAASADPNAREEGGLTPLHLAAWYGHADAATALLDVGADLEARTDQGNTPLDIAKRHNRQHVVDMLRRNS